MAKETVEIVVEVRRTKGKNTDTVRHACDSIEEATDFLKKHAKK